MPAAASIDDIFIQAIGIPESQERERYLELACAGDAKLRQQVEQLLAITPKLGSFLELPAGTRLFGETLRDPATVVDLSGQTLGLYRLIRLAGTGGMGTVYLAEQVAPIRRQVAIKVMRGEFATTRMLARFEHERHSLALMDHANIARVLDAGTTSAGAPFIAMEWVDGIPLTTFCDQEIYSIRQRIELLVSVCRAVQHAHQKGIIHRDLKPSNVLVTVMDGVAVPKVIDFGVAKAAESGLSAEAGLTEVGQIIGTLEYMAPEQAGTTNQDVDTRADVFALGALLHELLTGIPPVSPEQMQRAGLGERLRLIREVEPGRPSDRIKATANAREIAAKRQTEVTQLRRLVANELDWITLKCLEKDRARRYETANALAQDLARFLAGQPVQAGPPTVAYRFRKFATRNRWSLAVASALGLLLVAAATISTWQSVRLGRLNEQSNANLKAANRNLDLAIAAIDQYCTKVSEDLRLKEQDLRPLRKELLSTAIEYQEKLVELRNQSGAARIDLARAHYRLGKLSQEIDSHERAVVSLRQAVDGFRTVKGPLDRQPAIDLKLAHSLRRLAQSLHKVGEPAQASLAAVESLEILQRLLKAEPGSYSARSALADVRAMQAYYAKAVGQFDEAEAFAKLAIDEWGVLATQSPSDPVVLSNWAYARSQLGRAMFSRSLSRWREAEVLLTDARAIARKATELKHATSDCDVRLGEILVGLGQICKFTGRSDEAIAYFNEAIALIERCRIREPSVRSHTICLAVTHTEMARLYGLMNRSQDERASLETAIDLLDPLVRTAVGDMHAESSLVSALSGLSRLRLEEGDLSGAEVLLDRGIDLAEINLRQTPSDQFLLSLFSGMLERRAIVRTRQGRLDEAMRDYDRLLDTEAGTVRATARISRGEILLRLGDHDEAMAAVREVDAAMPADTPPHAQADTWLASARLCTKCAAAVGKDGKLSSEEQSSLAAEYAATAVRLLGKALESGFADLDTLANSPDFAPLHERQDFQSLFK